MTKARFSERWRRWRWIALGLAEAALLAAVALTFWLQEWRYAQAAPKPVGLVQPPLGSPPPLPEGVAKAANRGTSIGPKVLHFFNPDCPCSRFTASHLRDLSLAFTGRAEFVAVLEGEGTPAELEAAFESWELELPCVVDVEGGIAAAVGVYSTPQAVVLARDGTLYYRGNYNVRRFCDDRRTQFVRRALESLLPEPQASAAAELPFGLEPEDAPFDPLDPRACTSFGCPLPFREPPVGAARPALVASAGGPQRASTPLRTLAPRAAVGGKERRD